VEPPASRARESEEEVIIRALKKEDVGYALFSWRESAKKAPGLDRLPWSYFKDTLGYAFEKILNDPSTRLLGAYSHDEKLLGWIAITPGKRVHTVHWVYVKHELDGKRMRRRGVMTALIDAADLGSKFVYTLRGRRLERDARPFRSLDETLVATLRARGVTATFVPLREWLK
jgi:hypothetical protein